MSGDLISRADAIAALRALNHGNKLIRAKQSVTDRAIAALEAMPASTSGVPVAWQRLHPQNGWQTVDPEAIEHYRKMGQEIRPLYTQPAATAVKVKPLVWQGSDPDYTHADCSFGRYTVINIYHDRGFMLQIADSRTASYTRTMGEAQAAAQADYETRILAALEGGEE